MTFEEIDQVAKNSLNGGYSRFADNLDLIDEHLFGCLCDLYYSFSKGLIIKENAKKKKQSITNKWRDARKTYDFQKSMYSKHILDIAKTEDLRCKLRKQLNNGINDFDIALELISLYSSEKF